MTTTTDAPDWRELVEADGADPGIVYLCGDTWVELRALTGALGVQAGVDKNGTAWWHPNGSPAHGSRRCTTPRDAIRAALAWLRETLDREIAERHAARGRLGK